MKSKRLNISRRDFMNGISVSALTGLLPSPLTAFAQTSTHNRSEGFYPPAEMGMRGSHEGSYEVAHDLAFGQRTWTDPDRLTDDLYDLVIVGGGISGLAAAHFYRSRYGSDTRILILDNHDDFGGHAKRNEFTVDGKTIYGYGGSQSIDTPREYSDVAKALLRDIGVETDRFYKYYDQSYFSDRNLVEKTYFDKEFYDVARLAPSLFPIFGEAPSQSEVEDIIGTYPLSEAGRKALTDLVLKPQDYLAGRSLDEKRNLMRRTSYIRFLQTHVGVPGDVALLLQRVYAGLWGFGWDALSAMEGLRLGMPGLSELGVTVNDSSAVGAEEPYIFHFPDGNASVARLLARKLIPGAIPGETMEDIVTARADYSKLDLAGSPVRIRLLSTVVKAHNTSDGQHVDVTYVSHSQAFRVRSRHAVMAGYGHMLRHICPEMGDDQKEALDFGEKTPIVYTNVALRNWHAFARAGTYRIFVPQGFFHSIALDFPVSMGQYAYPSSPDEPIIATLNYVPITPGAGGMKVQSRLGRQMLYQLDFSDFEENVVSQLTGALGPYGFDAERDIAGITVNRWPHGYAYEYDELEDDLSFGTDKGPHILGRTPIGRITIANSDSHANAYVDGAIDAAYRAVGELSD